MTLIILTHDSESYYPTPESPFREALRVITNKEPPDYVVGYSCQDIPEKHWLDLQDWASNALNCEWMTGIGTIEAAEHIVKCAVQNGNISKQRKYMGLFDTFTNGKETVELKIGPRERTTYEIGDWLGLVEVDDGAYRGSGECGWVVIENNCVVFVTEGELPNEYSGLDRFDNYGYSIEE